MLAKPETQRDLTRPETEITHRKQMAFISVLGTVWVQGFGKKAHHVLSGATISLHKPY